MTWHSHKYLVKPHWLERVFYLPNDWRNHHFTDSFGNW